MTFVETKGRMPKLPNKQKNERMLVQFSHSVVSDSLRPHESQMAGLPVHHQLLEFTQTYAIESVMPPSHLISVVPFSSCRQSLPALGSFPMSQLFA